MVLMMLGIGILGALGSVYSRVVAIVLVQTRWSEKDMTGQLLRAMAKDPLADQWEVVELPAIFEDGRLVGLSIGV